MDVLVSKKSQTTLFIILALVIVFSIILFFLVRQDYQTNTIHPDIAPVNTFVSDCVQKTAEDAVHTIGDTGGYFYAPALSTDNHIAYYLYEENDYMPTRERVESELSAYMNTMLFFCVRGFEDFHDFEVRQGEIETKTIIENERVVFAIDYPLSIQKGENSYSLSHFTLELPVRLGVMYAVAEAIMQEQMEETRAICINCIATLAEEHDLFVDLHDYDNDTVLFYIIDRNSILQEEEYLFRFANKYESI